MSVTLDAGPNPTIPYKTDTVGSDQVPVLKLDIGGTGASVAVTAGQKAEASSIPVVLATEQDTAKDGAETAQGSFTGIGVLKEPPFEGNPAWAGWPASEAGIPYIGVFGFDESTQVFRKINAHSTSYLANGAALVGLLARSSIQGPYSSNTSDTATAYVANSTPGVSDYGIVARIIPSGTQDVNGAVAHDAADSGNPVKVGARARTSAITALANNDRSDLITDRFGRLLTLPFGLDEDTWVASSASDVTNTTSTAVKTATASVVYYVFSMAVSNLSATVSTRVEILDGTNVLWGGAASADGGGWSHTFLRPVRCTVNTALNVRCGTTGAAVRAYIHGMSLAS